MHGDSPLIDAARRGREADVAALLEAGADVNEPDEEGYTLLHVACYHGCTEIVTKLIAANADANQGAARRTRSSRSRRASAPPSCCA